MSAQELTKNKRIRAGHKSSVTRIIAQVKETLEADDWNAAKLKQHLQLLQGKQNILNKLDAEILEGLETEDEITGEIELADIFKENVAMTIIDRPRDGSGKTAKRCTYASTDSRSKRRICTSARLKARNPQQ